jgi:hypothetical protein
MDAVGDGFVDLIRTSGETLRDMYGLDGVALTGDPPAGHSWPMPWANVRPEDVPASFWSTPAWNSEVIKSVLPEADPRLSYIFSDGKMTPELTAAFVDSSLGVKERKSGLLGMHPKLAFVYMHVLASEMAADVMSLVTDDDFDHLSAGFTIDRLAESLCSLPRHDAGPASRSSDRIAVDFAMIALKTVVPRNLNNVPVEKIIELRQCYTDEFHAFQEATREIAGHIPEAVATGGDDTRKAYLQVLNEKTLGPALRSLRSSLNRSGIDTVVGAMNLKVQVPQILTAGSALFGMDMMHLNHVVVGSSAITLSLVPMIRRLRMTKRQARSKSKAAFLLRVDEELSQRSLAASLGNLARRLAPS